MCGIFGLVGRPSRERLREAALTLRHRGPDAFGEWWSESPSVYLALCRLSIIDLSDAGRQPLGNEDGSVQITFNGEIYNFQELRQELVAAGHWFRSRTDTEVIVHGYEQWGDAVVTRLRGMFAFGLWDSNQERLLLARDRLGIKPLFYSLHGDELAFASEPRALLAIPGRERSLEVPGAIHFLQHSYLTGPQTIWRGIFRMTPATTLSFDARRGTVSTRRYWCYGDVDASWTSARATEVADSLLLDAVSEELISDVPVGVFLSGGVDSSLVSAYAAAASPNLKSFFVDFAAWEGSERADATNVARHLGTDHTVCLVDHDSSWLGDPETARELFRAFDEPVGDPAIVPTWLLSRLIRQHVTVALSGDGGDELFGGYRWYGQVKGSLRHHLAWAVEGSRRYMGLGREWPEGCAGADEYYALLLCPSFRRSELSQLFPQWGRQIDESHVGRGWVDPCGTMPSGQRRWQLADVHTYLVDNNLARVDRASMAHSLEVRVPLLDHRVAEFALSLPEELRSAAGDGKPLLRRLTQRHLPSSVRDKGKQGFSFPLRHVIGEHEMITALRGGALTKNGLLDERGFQRWLDAPAGTNRQLKLWLLFVLDNWADQWLFGLSPA